MEWSLGIVRLGGFLRREDTKKKVAVGRDLANAGGADHPGGKGHKKRVMHRHNPLNIIYGKATLWHHRGTLKSQTHPALPLQYASFSSCFGRRGHRDERN